MKVGDICRKRGISQPTLYQWQQKYSGIRNTELKRMKDIQAEISKQKRTVKKVTLQKRCPKNELEKYNVTPAEKWYFFDDT